MIDPCVRILLIEDDEDDYLLTRHLLKEIETPRFELDWVNTFEGGLESAARNQHDVVLLDYHLGYRTGLELLRETISRGCITPIIVLTGQPDRATDLAVMEA